MTHYFNLVCHDCVTELPVGESPGTYARLEVLLGSNGRLTIRCVRHDQDIMGFQIPDEQMKRFRGMGCAAPDCPGHGEGVTL